MNLLEMLETLVNLHDGVADGGDGITEADWQEARDTIATAYKPVVLPAESITEPGEWKEPCNCDACQHGDGH